MKKTLLFTLVLVIAALLLPMAASAVAPTYNYEAAKLTAPVTVDGVNSPGEWDDANPLVVNSESAVFKEFGRWQGAEGNDIYGPDKLSITMKFKWDETNLYILEERFDPAYFFPADKDATEPWTGDGTLFFIAYDNGDPKWAHAYEPFWVNKLADGKTDVALRAWIDGVFQMTKDPAHIGNWKFAGANKDNIYTTEIVIPWSDIKVYNPDMPAAAEGTKFRFTPIISNVSSDVSGGTDWNQINMHDRFNRDDKVIDESDNPGELPANWAGFILTAALPVAEPETLPEELAADLMPETGAKTAPKTGDSAIFFVVLAALALAGVISVRKARSK